MVSGFFRSPDIMGWHAAMAAMFSLFIAFRSSGWRRWGWLSLGGWALMGLLLCGRRKMIYMLPLFISCFLWLNFSQGAASKRFGLLGVLIVFAILSLIGYQVFNPDSVFLEYYTYSPTDALVRLEKHGLDAVATTFKQSGILGEGLGFASTGAHHISAPRPRIWQEGGLSRLAIELGAPGLACFFFMGWQIAVNGLQIVRVQIPRDSEVFQVSTGLFAILVANASGFVVSGQHYGDPFIGCLVAIFIGMFFSTVRFAGTVPRADSAPDEGGVKSPVQVGRPSSSPGALRENETWEELVLSLWSKRR
jgi:hypothetical protein